MLPVLYGTLSKLWVANIDSSQVVTTDVYIYIGVIVNVLNDGLPRTAWNVIGDKTTRTPSSRIGLTYTLLLFQIIFGAILTVIFVASSDKLAAALFLPLSGIPLSDMSASHRSRRYRLLWRWQLPAQREPWITLMSRCLSAQSNLS